MNIVTSTMGGAFDCQLAKLRKHYWIFWWMDRWGMAHLMNELFCETKNTFSKTNIKVITSVKELMFVIIIYFVATQTEQSGSESNMENIKLRKQQHRLRLLSFTYLRVDMTKICFQCK